MRLVENTVLPAIRYPHELRAWWADPDCVEHRKRYLTPVGERRLIQACQARVAELEAQGDVLGVL